MNIYHFASRDKDMSKLRSNFGETFTRRVLIPHWFEIASGIFVGLSLVLIFAAKIPAN
jgi:hypothetical protein